MAGEETEWRDGYCTIKLLDIAIRWRCNGMLQPRADSGLLGRRGSEGKCGRMRLGLGNHRL